MLFANTLVSCTCGTPLEVSPIQRDDKKLACKDVILEINEAEHYRDEGVQSQGINMGEALMPICWASGYVDGSKAVKAANSRIDYLGQIYDLLDCGGNASSASSPPPPTAIAVPIQRFNNSPPAAISSRAGGFSPPAMGEGRVHYQSKGNNSNKHLHEHKDAKGRVYIHSHPHEGVHRHLEDE